MALIESFTTAGLDPRSKLSFWNDRACESFSPLVSDPTDIRSFNGSISRTRIGELSLAEVYSEAQIVRHSRAHVARTRSALFFLHLMLEGESINRQDGREAILKPGDFTLCDSTRHYEIVFGGPNRMLVLGIPDNILRRHVACPESLVAIPSQAQSGVGALLSRFVRNFWTECQQDLDDAAAQRVTVAILDLMSAVYAEMPQARSYRSSLATAHRIRIINFIEQHLNDPDLTPTRVAEACRMTTRYLHHLFSDEDETVARYILRRRLEACSRALTSLSQRGRTVTAIAFDYGFNSPTHFGRVFRSKYGATPREYRRETNARL
jgi:AraC family transcriptional regulator, positive regulator of tynA and feaB